jgi:hypothetical protein
MDDPVSLDDPVSREPQHDLCGLTQRANRIVSVGELLAKYQQLLIELGIQLSWPEDIRGMPR